MLARQQHDATFDIELHVIEREVREGDLLLERHVLGIARTRGGRRSIGADEEFPQLELLEPRVAQRLELP